jgi:hypothetical protein
LKQRLSSRCVEALLVQKQVNPRRVKLGLEGN